MVSPSKKKRKVTTVMMKAAKAKQSNGITVAMSSGASPNKATRPRLSSLSPSLKSKTAAIAHPSSSKIYPPLNNSSFFSSIRKYSKDGTDMLSELSKNVLNDFDLKYEKKVNHNGTRTSIRLLDIHDEVNEESIIKSSSIIHKHTILSSYRRCLIEDFMVLNKEASILVLIPFKPECPLLQQDSFWFSIDNNSFMNYQSIVQFKKKKYHCISASVSTNPKLESVKSGITQFDLIDGLGSKNSGCLINFGNDDDGDLIHKLITWNMVLMGGITGIQVWSDRKEFRNLSTAFNNRKKTNIGLVSLLNVMYYELYGDRLQCMYLMSCFYRTQLKQKQLELVKNTTAVENTNKVQEEILFEGTKYNNLITDIDITFKNAIISTYTSFCVLGDPLVSANQINVLVERFKIEMKVHYYMMKRILGIDKKERLTKNNHLVTTGYYDRLIFYNFLSLSRLRNPQSCINYAMVSAAALYSKGCGDNIQKRFTYTGASSTVKTFLRHVRPYGENMLISASSLLYKSKVTVATLDNNQKGHPNKYQRFGSSNKFVKVTARYFKNYTPYVSDVVTSNKHPIIEYVNQSIPSPNPMIPFEKIFHNGTTSYPMLLEAVQTNNIESATTENKIDFSGNRVKAYATVIDMCDEIQFCIRTSLTGYNRGNRVYKYVKNMPVYYQTEERDEIVKLMNSMKTSVIAKCSSFQTDVTLGWNPLSNEATKLLIPPVSLRDEIKTDGFGMAVIELLCLVGILHEEKVSPSFSKWELDRDWKQRRMFLCIDGLSLDRHRHFQKKLSNVKLSFTNAFKQSVIFQKALTRVTEIYGPLHMAFHMLQTIYTLYGTMLKWGQTIVDWKRITASKVCDSFDLCRQLMFLMLEELDRLAWDMFLFEKKDYIKMKKEETENENEFLFVLVDEYLKYIISKAGTTNDERRKYMFYFILIGRKFRQFWYAMKCGDRVMQEHLTTQWIGIFFLLKKHNYVEICLCAIETEYRKISYDELQSIRINACIRYRKGCDSKGNPYPLHVLDEVMENINGWTKRLLLGPDENSWMIHSPNIMCAHKCNNFESDAFTKQRLDLTTNCEPSRKEYVSTSTKTTEPRKTVERRRVYEWSVVMFNDEEKRIVTEKDGFDCIKQLTTSLKKPNDINKPDQLEECIDDIFYNIDSIDNIDIVTDRSTVLNERSNLIDEEAVEDNTASNENTNRGKIHSLSMLNVFHHGNDELKKINVNKVRLNKKKRLERTDEFYCNIYHEILNDNDELDTHCHDVLVSTVDTKPWYMSTYDLLLQK